MLVEFIQLHPILSGVLASLAAGLATALGSIPVLFTRHVSDQVHDGLLGFAAGVMLAATFFSLLVPAIEEAGGGLRGAVLAGVGLMLGGIFLDLMDRYSPHTHFIKGPEGRAPSSRLAKIWLFIIAITIHNFPEGLAVGVGVGSGDLSNGLSLTLGIGLQNIPEGLAVALALLGEGYPMSRVFFTTLLTGLVEPIGAFIGLIGLMLLGPLVPVAYAFAGGAMLFVISDEIIPETHRRGYERTATYLMLVGFIVMMLLDVVMG